MTGKLVLVTLASVALISCQDRADQPSNPDSNVTRAAENDRARVSETARYHCANDQVVEVDWMAADGHPRLRTKAHPASIDMSVSGNDYGGGGYSLNGVETTPAIGLAWPGGKKALCQKL
jgi:hypothetical protein